MSTLPTPQLGHGSLYLYLLRIVMRSVDTMVNCSVNDAYLHSVDTMVSPVLVITVACTACPQR